jgi:hypothetical protein
LITRGGRRVGSRFAWGTGQLLDYQQVRPFIVGIL